MPSFSFKMLSWFGLLLSTVVFTHGSACGYTSRLIFQFPKEPFTALENVAVRPSGTLILTSTTTSTIYLLDLTQSNPSAEGLYTFPGADSCLGIAETSSDVFAVIVGNTSASTFTGVPGTFSIWSVNLRKSTGPIVSKVGAISKARILNGLAYLRNSLDIVLAADSEAGIVYSMNITTGVSAVAIQNAAFAPTSTFPLGINGLHPDADGCHLYFTNSALGTFGSIPIDDNGKATGAVKIIATDAKGDFYDDFAIDKQGNSWITNHPDVVCEVTRAGQQSAVLNNTQILQPTSAIFAAGGQTLYVVTAGEPSTGSGQVFEITI